MKKAIFVIAFVIASSIVPFFLFQPAYAACLAGYVENSAGDCVPEPGSANANNNGSGNGVAAGPCAVDDQYFLFFPTWYRGLDCDADGKINLGANPEVGPTVFKIALNILDIALRLAGILAVGFVLWGGFQYVIARGEPENAKKALDTILKAVIGMVIAMVAAIVVTFIVARLS